MADVWPMKFTGADREPFADWLAKCQEAGAARTMADAIRLAVQIARSVPTDQIPTLRAGNNQ